MTRSDSSYRNAIGLPQRPERRPDDAVARGSPVERVTYPNRDSIRLGRLRRRPRDPRGGRDQWSVLASNLLLKRAEDDRVH
jgi:hypothetical protein